MQINAELFHLLFLKRRGKFKRNPISLFSSSFPFALSEQ